MEKMLYVVWKHEGDSEKAFRQKLLEKVSESISQKTFITERTESTEI